MDRIYIKNRHGMKIAVVVERSENQQGVAFAMHGLGGFKEQEHIQTFAEAFTVKGFTVVRFDTTNSFGESDGNYEDATLTNYFEDLEDVISWSSTQDWYEEPFWLCGHSLGGISTALFAETFPTKVKALAPISTVVSGRLSLESPKAKKHLPEWEKSGWKIASSVSRPGEIKRLNWHKFKADKLKYDLLDKVDTLTMPVLLIVGGKDDSTPPEHQRILYEELPGERELHLIKNAPHTFRGKEHLREIKTIMVHWIESIKHKDIRYNKNE